MPYIVDNYEEKEPASSSIIESGICDACNTVLPVQDLPSEEKGEYVSARLCEYCLLDLVAELQEHRRKLKLNGS